jgi:hypothetical protein
MVTKVLTDGFVARNMWVSAVDLGLTADEGASRWLDAKAVGFDGHSDSQPAPNLTRAAYEPDRLMAATENVNGEYKTS